MMAATLCGSPMYMVSDTLYRFFSADIENFYSGGFWYYKWYILVLIWCVGPEIDTPMVVMEAMTFRGSPSWGTLVGTLVIHQPRWLQHHTWDTQVLQTAPARILVGSKGPPVQQQMHSAWPSPLILLWGCPKVGTCQTEHRRIKWTKTHYNQSSEFCLVGSVLVYLV